jgi:hypothetical protein
MPKLSRKSARKLRGGTVSLSAIQQALQTASTLESQLKEIQNSAETNTYEPQSSLLSSFTSSQPESNSYSQPESNSYSQPESNSYSQPESTSSSFDMMSDYNNEPSVDMSFKTDPNYKYSNPSTSVKLSYPRIIMLLQKLVSQNPSSDRAAVLEQLQNATSQQQVQQIINDSNLMLKGNYVMGGKTKKNKRAKKSKGKKSMRR